MKFNLKTLISICIIFSCLSYVHAQQTIEKITKSISVNPDVVLEIDASHCNFSIETWPKNKVSIVASIHSKTKNKTELQTIANAWDLSVSSDKSKVLLTSKGGKALWTEQACADIFEKETLDAILNLPLTENTQSLPQALIEGLGSLKSLKALPDYIKKLNIPQCPDGSYRFDFDYERYENEGESYLNTWSKNYKEKYGASFEAEMRDWVKIHSNDLKRFEKDMEQWGEKFGKDLEQGIEKWGKGFEKRMEAWGSDLEKKLENELVPKIEAWAENFGEELGKSLESVFSDSKTNKQESSVPLLVSPMHSSMDGIDKKVSIKVPVGHALQIKLRDGLLEIPASVKNCNLNVSHGVVDIGTVSGTNTKIDLAYSNLKINDWKEGELHLNYVDAVNINKASNLMLNAESSNIKVVKLSGNSIINGSFGDLVIEHITPSFNHLNLVLENSQAWVKLPQTDFNLFFTGKQSQLNDSFIKSKVFHAKNTTNKTIVITANYSSVKTK